MQTIEQVAQQYAMAVKQYPIAVQQAAQSGQQPPPPPQKPDTAHMLLPSVPIDVDWDDHAFEYGEVKSWINSPAGQAMKSC